MTVNENRRRGWIFTKENFEIKDGLSTEDPEIGFISHTDAKTAEDAMLEFGCQYPGHFSIYFINFHGDIFEVAAEDHADDFPYSSSDPKENFPYGFGPSKTPT